MRIALAQLNPTVGDLAGNLEKHIAALARARDLGAELVLFPELSLMGYPPKDLLLKPAFIELAAQAVERVAEAARGITAVVGYAEKNVASVGRKLHNAVAVVAEGRILSRRYKSLLPTYDVFDESRYFEPGPDTELTFIANQPLGISICEDLWNDEKFVERPLYHFNPIAALAEAGARVLLNISASPFVLGKNEYRHKLFSFQAKRWGMPIVYVNQVGGNDELVFDGNSVVFDAQGEVMAQGKGFEEDMVVVEVGGNAKNETRNAKREGEGNAEFRVQNSELKTGGGGVGGAVIELAGGESGGNGRPTGSAPLSSAPLAGIGSIHAALLLGLKDYVRKCGFKSVVLGLSGGIDSAVVGALAAEALGPENVMGVALPSRYSSGHSETDAELLARNLGIAFQTIPIEGPHRAMEQALAGMFAGTKEGLAEENVQARLRGNILMSLSNKFGHLLLTTGNKSEVATGYCTLYGDMCGGLALISDVPKMMVYELARFMNAEAVKAGRVAPGGGPIPEGSISKPPSAELRPNQKDQDSLPPYEILDEIIERYVEDEMPVGEIVAAGFEQGVVERVVRLIDLSEYKRKQMAPGIKVTSRAFGFGRRMPIAQRFDPKLARL